MIEYKGHKVYMDGQYPSIFLNGKNSHVHRLEWIFHNGEIPVGSIIHHKNENKLDWNIDNLDCLTRSEHLHIHKPTMNRRHTRVTCKRDTLNLSEIIHCNSVKDASRVTGVASQNISDIINGKRYKVKGWTFEMGWTL